MRFIDKHVVVTGAASGIGLEITRQFLKEGAKVTGTDLNGVRLSELAKELGPNFQGLECDAASVKDIQSLFSGIDNLDVLVNNAGIGIMYDPEQMGEDDYDKQLAVLIKGPTFHVKYAAPLLRQSANGSVVNISSASALISLHGYTAYAAAKAALVKFTQDAVITVPGVRHNVILPGLIETPILKDAYGDEALEKLRAVTMMGPVPRFGQPEDIAAATLFLASDEASFITGSELLVDGGLTRVHVMNAAG